MKREQKEAALNLIRAIDVASKVLIHGGLTTEEMKAMEPVWLAVGALEYYLGCPPRILDGREAEL